LGHFAARLDRIASSSRRIDFLYLINQCMRLSLNTSFICIVYLMLRRLPTTLSFLGSRAIPSPRAYVRTLASAEPIVSGDEKARTLISKLNLSLGKRARLASAGEATKGVRTPSTSTAETMTMPEPVVPQSATSAFGNLGLSDEIVNALSAQGRFNDQ